MEAIECRSKEDAVKMLQTAKDFSYACGYEY